MVTLCAGPRVLMASIVPSSSQTRVSHPKGQGLDCGGSREGPHRWKPDQQKGAHVAAGFSSLSPPFTRGRSRWSSVVGTFEEKGPATLLGMEGCLLSGRTPRSPPARPKLWPVHPRVCPIVSI